MSTRAGHQRPLWGPCRCTLDARGQGQGGPRIGPARASGPALCFSGSRTASTGLKPPRRPGGVTTPGDAGFKGAAQGGSRGPCRISKALCQGYSEAPRASVPVPAMDVAGGEAPPRPSPPGPAVQLSLSPTVACTPGFRRQLDDWCRLLTEEGPRCWAVGAGCAVPSSALPVLGSGPSAAHPSQADRPRQAPQLLLCRLQGRAWVMLRAQGGW